ncbi:hypothetical protein [Streptomyces sp. A1547]|uniref:hypothetical protein n=1 Tax=Streptomyces sp. A1547 TaxID=2563105 RepID=UPI00109E924C|nr:hypothetical protein [Streptomyces sp. A1547]THA28231.1 hypothetical protein E6W17_41260 [Streptomyces sp. A1547]
MRSSPAGPLEAADDAQRSRITSLADAKDGGLFWFLNMLPEFEDLTGHSYPRKFGVMTYVSNGIDDTESKINNVREALPHAWVDAGLHPEGHEGRGRTPSRGRFARL